MYVNSCCGNKKVIKKKKLSHLASPGNKTTQGKQEGICIWAVSHFNRRGKSKTLCAV